MTRMCLPSFSILLGLAVCIDSFQFHKELSRQEQIHYFGKELNDYAAVPTYEFTSPQRLGSSDPRDTTNDTLEYLLEAFGRQIHLTMQKNKQLITPGCLVQTPRGDHSRTLAPCSTQLAGCHAYTGETSDGSDTWVAATICGGLHGLIGLGDRTLMIQPIRKPHMSRARRETRLQNPHIIYQHKANGGSCDTDRVTNYGTTPKGSFSRQQVTRNERRRSVVRRYIETEVVVDKSMYEFHGTDTMSFIKTVLNIAAHRLLNPGLGTEIFLVINTITNLTDEMFEVVPDASLTLNRLCRRKPENVDYTLLLTRVDIVGCDSSTTGISNLNMCGALQGCSVNEDNGLTTGLTIAHETGHALGVRHDGDHNECEDGVNIMCSNCIATGADAFKWSSCSGKYLYTFLSNKTRSDCLTNSPMEDEASEMSDWDVMPGSVYSADQQCKLMYGQSAELFSENPPQDIDVCAKLTCIRPPSSELPPSGPRMDGTDCRDNNTVSPDNDRLWCIGGKCELMPNCPEPSPECPGPRDGGWSSWEPEDAVCSRTCGGGVKMQRRACNKPEPMYGGRPCEGPDVRGVLCNVQECSTPQTAIPEVQCALSDGGRKCDVTTGSGQRATFRRCVAGKCMAFGCDGHTDSGLQFDSCDVCNGHGHTCRKRRTLDALTLADVWRGKQQFGRRSANNVELDMYSWKSRDGQCSKTCGIGTQVPSITCEGRHGTVEDFRCNIYEKPTEIPEECSTAECPIRWRTSEWSECSRTCGGGEISRDVTCVRDQTEVRKGLCNAKDKPATTSTCGSTLCPAEWKVFGDWSSCSAGVQTKNVSCTRVTGTSVEIVDDSNCLCLRPGITQACGGGGGGGGCSDPHPNICVTFASKYRDLCTSEHYRTMVNKNCRKTCGLC